jgi:hypothetical protein
MGSVVLLGTTTEVNATGQAINVATLKRDKDALYTATISVDNFCGRILIQGTLVKHPKASDWFSIKIGDNRFIDYPFDPHNLRDSRVGALGDTAVDKFTFAGNYLQLRAVVDKSLVPAPSGKLVQVVISDEYSADLHNAVPTPIIVTPTPTPNPVPQSLGTTVEYATVTVDQFGKITNISAGDPTKISAQTYVVTLYDDLSKIRPPPQVGDAALVTSGSDPKRGYYVYTVNGWHGLADNDLSVKKDVVAGTYTYATIEVDKFGRIVSASNGKPAVVAIETSVSASFTADTPEVIIGHSIPPLSKIEKIVIEITTAFDPSCVMTVEDQNQVWITSSEIAFEESDQILIFEINQLYSNGGLFKILVNSNGTHIGSGKITITFSPQ